MLGGLAAMAVAATGGAAWKLNLFGRHYAPTPYDDLLQQLTDRDVAIQVGRAVRARLTKFDDKKVARELRQRFERRNLAEVLDADSAEGRLAEAGGWVLPRSLTDLCALAAG